MAIKLGTNFDLKSKQFLDSRQGLPETKTDLRDWSTPVPPGFEVCLDEVWYYYDPEASLPETGKWIPRLVGKNELLEGNEIVNGENRGVTAGAVEQINTTVWAAIDGINSRLDADADANAGYHISNIYWGTTASGTKLEVGCPVDTRISEYNNNPAISYKISGTGYTTTGPYYLDLTSSIITKSEGRTETKRISHDFEQPNSHVIKTLTADATLTWTYRRFWEAASEEEKSTLLGGGTQGYSLLRSKCGEGELSTSKSISEKTFDCTGGKYPFFVVYAGSVQEWTPSKVTVGGFANSNYTISKINLVNTFGIEIPYFVFMLNQIQTATNIKITIEG